MNEPKMSYIIIITTIRSKIIRQYYIVYINKRTNNGAATECVNRMI